MDQSSIFEPTFVMLTLTLLVWVYRYVKRIPFICHSGFVPEELTPLELQKRPPVEVSRPSDNLKSLFEIPVLFYFLSIYLFVTGQVDQAYLIAAWSFVVFRVFHSLVHCLFDAMMLRFALYIISTLVFWTIVLRIIFTNIG